MPQTLAPPPSVGSVSASNQGASSNKDERIQSGAVPLKPITLKGYIRQAEDGSYVGICLTLNLPVKARSLEEADAKLRGLIRAYLEDVAHHGNVKDFVPRRAPLSYYLEYHRLRFLARFDRISNFRLFVESAPIYQAHA